METKKRLLLARLTTSALLSAVPAQIVLLAHPSAIRLAQAQESALDPDSQKAASTIRDFLRAHPSATKDEDEGRVAGYSTAEIASATQVSPATASKALKYLVYTNAIKVTGNGSDPKYYIATSGHG